MKRSISIGAVLTVIVCCFFVNLGPAKDSFGADRSAVEDFVTRFYTLCLDRQPDSAGLNGWVSALLDGSQTGSDVAYGFVFSAEFINKSTTNEEYLTVLYEAFFNRKPDQGGWDGWLSALNSGTSREDVLNGYIFAVEFTELCDGYGITAFDGHVTKEQKEEVASFVTRFYQLCLGREPDSGGLNGWTDNLLGKILTGADVANGFIFSNEFIEQKTSNSDFLLVLYNAFFGRDPDPAGWDVWLAALNEGRHRQEALNGFIYSAEFEALCQQFGIKAYDSQPPPVSSDNSNFYGTYSGTVKSGSCPAEAFSVVVGDDLSKRATDSYIFIPKAGSSFYYEGYDEDGDYVQSTITIFANTINIREKETYLNGAGQWISEINITFAGDYQSFTISGHETDDDPGSCSTGSVSGSGSRQQSQGAFGGVWAGQVLATTPTDMDGDPCTSGSIQIEIINNQIYGTANVTAGQFDIYGTINITGAISGTVYSDSENVAILAGTLSGNSGGGNWQDFAGCVGTWSVTKQ